MSKSVPDLEQALVRTSRGRARRPVEPHEDRTPRVMIAIHVDPEVRDQLRAIAYEQKVPLRGLVVRHVIIFGHGHGLQRAIIDESQHRTPERLIMAQH